MNTGLNIVGVVKKQTGYVVTTSQGKKENLNIETLDSDNVGRIYCEVKGQMSPVVFDRMAKEQFLKLAKVREGYWGLEVKGVFYPFAIAEIQEATKRTKATQRTPKRQAKRSRPKRK